MAKFNFENALVNVAFDGMKASICELKKNDGTGTYYAWVIEYKDGTKEPLWNSYINHQKLENLELRRELGKI